MEFVRNSYGEISRNFEWNIPRAYNLGREALRHGRVAPDAVAIVAGAHEGEAKRYTFGQLDRWSNMLANRLLDTGAASFDRVMVVLPASLAAAVAHLAVLKAGLVAVPVISTLDGPSLKARLDISGSRIIITSSAIHEVHEALFRSMPELLDICIADDARHDPAAYLEERLSPGRDRAPQVRTNAADPAILAFTSGTTGEPKGVVVGHQVVEGILPGMLFTGPCAPEELVWAHFDWGWLGGLNTILASLRMGRSFLVTGGAYFDPEEAFDTLSRMKVSHASVAPTVLRMWREMDVRGCPPSLTSLTTGGERLDADLYAWVSSALGLELSQLYGMTECGGVIGSGGILPARPGALGKPAPGCLVSIIDESGKELPDGESGFIGVKKPHPSMFMGYWNDDLSTEEKFKGDFLVSGDMGFRDGDGYIWYLDRSDDVVKVGASRVSLASLEKEANCHACVFQSAAVAVPDEYTGDSIVLYLELKREVDCSPEDARRISRDIVGRLAPYEKPREVIVLEQLPLTATGKIDRKALKESLLERG